MNSFSEELRNARESRNITLADISKKTRIGNRYLQAIEQGTFDVLPQTYVRAFIKAYAEAIGLNAAEVMHKYDIQSTPEHKQETAASTEDIRLYLKPERVNEELKQNRRSRVRIFTITAVLVVAALSFYLLNYFETITPRKTVEETSFQEVVKNQEKIQPAVVNDSLDTTTVAKIQSPKIDSLVLRIVSSDSVWITIIRDSLPPRSGYMLNGRYRTYVARKSFHLSLSDGGAVKLILNGMELPSLGERGKRIRNYKISAENILKK
ncbi:MAG: helix-turn-helix domain-containing protein [Bacteroidota bacterium]|nr:helix-turn-helix domain-containing protein [Bacteroidota bacterium]